MQPPTDEDQSLTTSLQETANERLKRRSAVWQSNALVIAVLAHVGVLVSWPTMTSAVVQRDHTEIEVLAVPDVTIPPRPEELARPATPVIGAATLPDDITIPNNTWDQWTPDKLTPPANTGRNDEREKFVDFVRTMVAPRVLNQPEVERALVRNYPAMLREAGIGGQVDVLLWLDESGGIVRAEIAKSSGHAALDDAALKVVDVMRLTPALNHNRPTRVIVSIPILFKSN